MNFFVMREETLWGDNFFYFKSVKGAMLFASKLPSGSPKLADFNFWRKTKEGGFIFDSGEERNSVFYISEGEILGD